jgi:hypothetical protein
MTYLAGTSLLLLIVVALLVDLAEDAKVLTNDEHTKDKVYIEVNGY